MNNGLFRYAMCNESMQGLSWQHQCRIVAEAGYQGIEVAPFSLIKESVRDLTTAHRQEMVRIMHDQGLECCGLHWLLSPPPQGLHFTTPDKTIRQKSVAYLDELIDFCGDLGGTVMTFGSPPQRSADGIAVDEAKKYFAEGLAAVADHAGRRQVRILIEHLAHEYTNVINTLAEAVELAGRVNHPAIGIMFDFHNTGDETEPFDVLIRKYFDDILHVHIQEMDGQHLGTGNAVNDFVAGFQALKDLNYNKWISLEVFDFAPGGPTIAHESMKILKQIENKLS